MTRDEILNAVMIAPETTEFKGVQVRKMNLESMGMLAHCGNPMADISSDPSKLTQGISVSALNEAIFIHAAPPEIVRECVWRNRALLAEAASAFCARFDIRDMEAILKIVVQDLGEIRAAQADVVPDPSLPKSKNEPSPAA